MSHTVRWGASPSQECSSYGQFGEMCYKYGSLRILFPGAWVSHDRSGVPLLQPCTLVHLQQSPTFLAPEFSFMKENLFHRQVGVVLRFTQVLNAYCALLLHQLHLRLSGVRSWRLGTLTKVENLIQVLPNLHQLTFTSWWSIILSVPDITVSHK